MGEHGSVYAHFRRAVGYQPALAETEALLLKLFAEGAGNKRSTSGPT